MRSVDGMACEWVVVPRWKPWPDPSPRRPRPGLFIPVLNFHNTCKETPMPKDLHQKAAEHHEQAAKAHRTAAQQHGSSDHVSAKQQSAQAAEKSKAAHDHSTQANN